MFFRRPRVRQPSYEELIEGLGAWGFRTEKEADGSVLVMREGCAARVRKGADGKPLVEQTGWMLDGQCARLVDGGFQKFWLAPGGRRKPAFATQLKVLHQFEEDLREALGLVSLYNTSLGTVNALHLYDRLKSREDGALP